jgi:hypothetical protein
VVADARLVQRIRAGECAGADLRDANLRGADLRCANLRCANLQFADLCYADLRGADLSGADLHDANLHDAYPYDASLNRADLRGADLRGADLCGADLRGASFDGAYLLGSIWRRTRLHSSGTWDEQPPSCTAGDWHAMVVAPHIVRIGCKTGTIEYWLSGAGEKLADKNDVPDHDRWLLRIWLEGLALRDVWPGWVEG